MIRPGARAFLARWQEAGFGAGVLAAGLWVAAQGGWILLPAGGALAALGAALLLLALRRLRFAAAPATPGVVEVDEQQVGYLGPAGGGFVSLRELVELRLIARGGQRFWRLKQSDGQALLIPVDAAGADRLFDAFAALPGLESGALVAALAPAGAPGAQALAAPGQAGLGPVIWRRASQTALR